MLLLVANERMGLPQYVADSRLCLKTLEIIRMYVPAEDYGAARDKADELEAKRHWIMCSTAMFSTGRCLDERKDGS